MIIDWSKAPEWAGCVITSCASDSERIFYWAEPWGTDGKRCQLGREDRPFRQSEDVADTSGINHRWQLIDNRPIAWTGEGLPPVGIEFEFTTNSGYNWHHGSMLFSDSQVVLLNGYQLFRIEDPDLGFRPIRTPEHIAAEARKDAISKMLRYAAITGESYRDVCGKLYDAGYRKLEPTDES